MTEGESTGQGQLPTVDGWPRFTYWVKVGAAVIAIVVALLGVLTLKTVFLLILASLVLAMGMQTTDRVLRKTRVEEGCRLDGRAASRGGPGGNRDWVAAAHRGGSGR